MAAGFRSFESSGPELGTDGLLFLTVKSAALGQRADITLFVPRRSEGLCDVPIVILLHGVYGSHWAWALKGHAHRTAARLIDEGAIPPLVLAMPSDGLWGDGSGYVPHAEQDFEGWVIDDVPAAVRLACVACSGASPLCIAGLSMGGFAALRIAGKHRQRVAAAAGHSSLTEASQLGALLAESRAGWSTAPEDTGVFAALTQPGAALPALRFDCGVQDPQLEANRNLHAALLAAGLSHEYAEHAGGHDWGYWRRHIEDTLRFFGGVLQTGTQRA